MENEDIIVEQRLNGLRGKLPANTQLALNRTVKLLLKAGYNLPSNGTDVSKFLLSKADAGLKISALRNYCSMIIKWHRMGEYHKAADDIARLAQPVLNGLKIERIENGKRESRKSATPLLLADAMLIDNYLSDLVLKAHGSSLALSIQDLCLFRVLWWSGARESEIASLKRWQITLSNSPRGILLEWAKTKTDTKGLGTSRIIPALPNADPFGAMEDWLDLYWPHKDHPEQSNQPVFIRQHRNGSWRESNIHPNSIPLWLRKIARSAGVPYWSSLSGHSCRHGLATMLADRLPIREVMDYFKWKQADTAYGYVTNKGISENIISNLATASLSNATLLSSAKN